jgi:tetratricopeptide (TPR) repeat protein
MTSDQILYIIELGVQEKFPEALDSLRALEEINPQNPALHFYKASILQSMMMDYESNLQRDEFIAEIEMTISLCDSLLKTDRQQTYALFYRGAALSYKGFQLSREKKYLGGIRAAVQGISTLEKVLKMDSTYTDACLAIGSYKYWRSYLTRHFSWLPFFPDQRREGIHYIERAYEKSKYSKWAALSSLGWIYIQEEQYQQAIRCAEEGLNTFPQSRFFLWLLGDALYKDKQYQRALQTYEILLNSVISAEINNHYNEILLHLKLAQCFLAVQNNSFARYHARLVLEIVPDAEVQDRVKEKKQDAEKLLREIEK